MASSRTVGRDLTSGSILKNLIVFALPLVAANIIQQLYTTVDMVVIGKLAGSVGTVGVSVGGQASMFFTMLAMAFGGGGQVYISQLFGAGDRRGVSETIGTLLSFVTLLSLGMMAIAIPCSSMILNLMNTPAEAFSDASGYMIITCCGFPFIFGYNALGAIMRGMGDSKRPLLFISVAAVTNVVLDIIFVAVFKWGAPGTALATVIGQALAFFYALYYLLRHGGSSGFVLSREYLKVRWHRLRVLLKLGLPMVVQNGCIVVTLMYVNSLINAFGLVASATNSVGEKIFSFANTFSMSLNAACASMIGQNLGAGKPERAKKVVMNGFAIAYILCAVSCAMALLIPKPIYSIFTSDPEVIDFGVMYMKVSVITFLLASTMGPAQAMVTGSGFASLGFAVGILDGVVFRLGFVWLFTHVLDMQVVGLWLASSLARIGPIIVCFIYLFSGKWRTHRLLVDKTRVQLESENPAEA